MALTDYRKNTLATNFGDSNGCITDRSYLQAFVADCVGSFYLNAEDMIWLKGNESYCSGSGTGGTGGGTGSTGGSDNVLKTGIFIDAGKTYADVYVGDAKVGTTDVEIDMAPGGYTFEVSKTGYMTESFWLQINQDQVRNWSVDLKLESGEQGALKTGFFLDSNGLEADVYIDNVLKGKTMTIIEVPTGDYVIEVRKQGYNTDTFMLAVYQNNVHNWSVSLKKASDIEPGQLTGITFSADLAYASVFIGDEQIGSTDTLIELPAGVYTFVIKKAGYKVITRTENIIDGYQRNIEITLDPGTTETSSLKTGINIFTNGLDADVYVDDAWVGLTDTIIELPEGTYTFKIIKTGYKTRTLSANIFTNNISNPQITLTPQDPAQETGADISMTLTNNFQKPDKIYIGTEQWFGVELRNDTDRAYRAYIGIRLTDIEGTTWSTNPDRTFAQQIEPGETKMIKRKITIPMTLKEGAIVPTFLLAGYFIS